MKKVIFLCLLVSGFALPAHAGHGTIRETETQVFVEYYGDANDKATVITTPVASAQPRQMQPPGPRPAEAAAQPVARQAGKERAAGKAQQDEARRQQRATLLEQAQDARRQRQVARTSRTARNTGSSQNEE